MIKQLVIAGLLFSQVAPAAAADLGPDPAAASQRSGGAFAGARVRFALGAKSRASAGLSLAPVQYSTSAQGGARIRFGEGLSFQSLNGSAPVLNLGGRPLKPAKMVRRAAQDGSEKDGGGGIGTLGYVAIGIGVLALITVVAFQACADGEICGSDRDD